MEAANPEGFTANLEVEDRRAMVQLTGEMDLSTGPVLRRLFVSALDFAPATISVDLGDVTFLDAAGVSALLSAASLAGERGCEVTIHRAAPAVVRVLRLLDVHDRLPIERTQA